MKSLTLKTGQPELLSLNYGCYDLAKQLSHYLYFFFFSFLFFSYWTYNYKMEHGKVSHDFVTNVTMGVTDGHNNVT